MIPPQGLSWSGTIERFWKRTSSQNGRLGSRQFCWARSSLHPAHLHPSGRALRVPMNGLFLVQMVIPFCQGHVDLLHCVWDLQRILIFGLALPTASKCTIWGFLWLLEHPGRRLGVVLTQLEALKGIITLLPPLILQGSYIFRGPRFCHLGRRAFQNFFRVMVTLVMRKKDPLCS